jgi:trehalose-phosphatase
LRGRRAFSIASSAGKGRVSFLDRTDDPRGAVFESSDGVAAEVRRRFEGRHLLLLTDFDGTLAELAATPAEAVLSDHVRTEFNALQSIPEMTVGVVSGRRLADVRARVGPSPEFTAGQHGLEIEGPISSFRHGVLETVEPVLAKVAETMQQHLSGCPGCLLENKTYALTCHVRLAPPELADSILEEFESLAEPLLETRVLRLLVGAKAMELLPAVDWDKGRAVSWIRKCVERQTSRPVSVVYLGDDRTDEDAFSALGDDDMAIGVGTRPHTHLIDCRLAGPASVGRFFAKLRQS